MKEGVCGCGKINSCLAMGFRVGHLRHGGKLERSAALRGPPDGGNTEQFLVKKHAESPGGRQENASHHDVARSRFWEVEGGEVDRGLKEREVGFEEGIYGLHRFGAGRNKKREKDGGRDEFRRKRAHVKVRVGQVAREGLAAAKPWCRT